MTALRARFLLVTLVVLLALVLVVGCGGQGTTSEPEPTPVPAEETTTTPDTDVAGELTPVMIYLVRDDEKVHPVRREVEGPAVAEAALVALFDGPDSDEFADGNGSEVPAGTTLLGVTIDDGVATVDVSSEFGSGGGSLSMFARIAQVVYTATQFDTVESVLFEMNGEPLDALGGEGVILEGPQTRDQWEDFAPEILVESPARGDRATMGAPLRVMGSANVFEARFTLEVTDGDGLILLTEPVMATSGTGTRGTFDLTVTPAGGKSGHGAVIVSYSSPKDGARVVVDEIPLVFE